MLFFVTIVTGGLAQVSIFPTHWPVAATIITIASRSVSCVDHSGRAGALRPGATGTTIATIPIAPNLLVVPARSLGLSVLAAIRSHGSYLRGVEQKGALALGEIRGRF